MIAVEELDRIARARLDDAKSLLASGRFDCATYVCGYAVEVALKARICRTLNWSEFPATGGEFALIRAFGPTSLTSCCVSRVRKEASNRGTSRS